MLRSTAAAVASSAIDCERRAKLSKMVDTKISHLVLLEVVPRYIRRIELWGVSREKLHFDVPVERFNEFAHQAALVHLQPVPDDQQLALDLRFERLQELDNLRPFDRTAEQAEVELPIADARDQRKLFPIEAVLQYRSLRCGRPRAHARWTLREPRLVYEDDGSRVGGGVFFSVGQRLFFHRAMAFSSRCSARFSGRWQLQPIAAKRRETWLVLYENPKRCSISLAMRGKVHNSVAYPCARAPAISAWASCSRLASFSREGRPRTPLLNAARPPCCKRLVHANTVGRYWS